MKEILAKIKEFQKKKVIVFGTGSYSKSLCNQLPFDIAYFVDNNPDKWGSIFEGLPVNNPQILLEENRENVGIVIASQYYIEISEQLKAFGYLEEHYWKVFELQNIFDAAKSAYNNDGLFTKHNCDFMSDPFIQECFNIQANTNGEQHDPHYWRTYIYLWAGKRQMALDGDFVECGVCKGGSARALIHYTDFGKCPKKFYLFDTYAGLLPSHVTEEEKALEALGQRPKYEYEPCIEQVKATFQPFRNVIIVQGAVPESLPNFPEEAKVSFISIDMNCVIPEIAAANFFWDKMVSGAIMLLDDYGWWGHIMQKEGFDKFAHEKGVEVLSLPTGQGLIIKP